MPFSKKRVKGQKRKLQFPCFLRLYVVNTIVWLFCESETCAFSVLFGYFATLPKDAALVQTRCWYAFITGTSVHFIGVRSGSVEFYSPGLQIYNLHILRMSVFSSIPKKREEKWIIIALIWGFIKALLSPSVELESMWSWIKLSF